MHDLSLIWPKSAFRFLTGGGGSNIAATPVAAAVPPVSSSAAEVVQASQDLRRQSLKKRGFGNSTIFAGDTGGWTNQNPATPSPTNPKPPASGAGAVGASTLGT